MTTTTIDLSQVQATVLRGYRSFEALPHIGYAFLELGDAASATRVVAGLAARVTSCAAWDEGSLPFALGVGLTAAGLRLLGQDTSKFPAEFLTGMAARWNLLGDTGESSPERWQPGFTSPQLHAVAVVSAATPEGMDEGRRFVAGVVTGAPGAKILFTEEGHVFPDHAATEHFGFIDGIGQPYVAGSGLVSYPGEGSPEPNGKWRPIATGDFVLGFRNEAGHDQYPDPPFRNGSYLVYRKLEERVIAFRKHTAAVAVQAGISPERAAARYMGRWQSGAPLDLAWEVDDPVLAKDRERNNDFRYDDDPQGFKCPHGSHARRNNPRADPTGPTLPQVDQHRLIRRSLPYGPWLPDGATSDDGVPRGIHFAVINADIANQFEYVQLNWINGTLSSTALSTEIDKDPIVGANDGKGKLVSPAIPQPSIAWDLPRFVEVRGGGYFFLPSLDVLSKLGGK
jgi:Dyp-type peroxidase family